MNCDEVFVILTRGPFPSGSPHDRRVEAHLQRCADCQRLAEALRPNDDTLRESIGLDEGGALPGYWGNSLGTAGDLAVSLSDGAGLSRLKRAPRRVLSASTTARSLNVWQFTAAVALGIVVAAALRTLVSGHPSRPRFISSAGAGEGNGDVRTWAGSNGDERGTPLDLPAVCRGGKSPNLPESVDPILLPNRQALDTPACCTVCHHAGSDTKTSEAAKIRLKQSCSDCHDQTGR